MWAGNESWLLKYSYNTMITKSGKVNVIKKKVNVYGPEWHFGNIKTNLRPPLFSTYKHIVFIRACIV